MRSVSVSSFLPYRVPSTRIMPSIVFDLAERRCSTFATKSTCNIRGSYAELSATHARMDFLECADRTAPRVLVVLLGGEAVFRRRCHCFLLLCSAMRCASRQSDRLPAFCFCVLFFVSPSLRAFSAFRLHSGSRCVVAASPTFRRQSSSSLLYRVGRRRSPSVSRLALLLFFRSIAGASYGIMILSDFFLHRIRRSRAALVAVCFQPSRSVLSFQASASLSLCSALPVFVALSRFNGSSFASMRSNSIRRAMVPTA